MLLAGDGPRAVQLVALLQKTGGVEKMSKYWVPINPPVVQFVDETDQKDSHAFPGTHMSFNVKQQQVQYMELSTDGPLGVPIPPYPTGRHEWRDVGPRVRVEADIHMTTAAVESMKDNEQLFADIMATFTSGTTALFFALGHATYQFGLAHAKNADGSLDIHIGPLGATAGGHPILLPPQDCVAILQAA